MTNPSKAVVKKSVAKKKKTPTKRKHAGGRPTVMTELTVNKLEQGFINGLSDVQACRYAGISRTTLFNYQEENPEFINRKEELREDVKMHAKFNIAKKVLGTGKGDGDIDTSKYVLDRTDSDFKPKNKLEIEGMLSKEEMDAQAKRIADYLDEVYKELK